MSLKIHPAIHLPWLKELPNAVIPRQIDYVYGEGVIRLRAIQTWTHRFTDGDHSLEDGPRTGRPRSTEHVSAIRALLVDDLYLSQKEIAFILNIN
jgi:hypothetical protein